jgi:hypothetical protein
VRQSTLSHPSGLHLLPFDPTVTLVTVQSDILAHGAAPFFSSKLSTASLNWRQESRFHIFISRAFFGPRNLLFL